MKKVWQIICILIFFAGLIWGSMNRWDGYIDKEQRGTSSVALHAIEYCGENSFCKEDEDIQKNSELAKKSINWLTQNYEIENNMYYWYEIDDGIYDNCFSQAVVGRAFLEYYKQSHDEEYLMWAKRAVDTLVLDSSKGGYFIDSEKYVGFGDENNSNQYELISELYSIVTLNCMSKVDSQYKDILDRALAGLEKQITRYDTGYCLRDNLDCMYEGINFRINDEYTQNNEYSFISEIRVVDPDTGASVIVHNLSSDGYFSCDFPEYKDDFKDVWYELHFTYEDRIDAHATVQIQSMIDEKNYVDVEDGDILLTGSNNDKEWIVPIRQSDLGYPVIEKKQKEYADILYYISDIDTTILSMADRANAYYNLNYGFNGYVQEEIEAVVIPKQTPMTVYESLDDNGVIRQHVAAENTKYEENSELVTKDSVVGKPYYNLVAIYCQAVEWSTTNKRFAKVDPDYFDNSEFWHSYNWLTSDNYEKVDPDAAYNWILKNANVDDTKATWSYDMENCYNDLIQKKGWNSAYGQSLMIKALLAHFEDNEELIRKASYAYGEKVEDGGYLSDNLGTWWYEEVPNKSHIFNAHILSINILQEVNQYLKDEKIEKLIDKGVESIKNQLWKYDNGYWSKYDQNPQKNSLFQIDWISGDESVLFDKIDICDPISEKKVEIDIGSGDDFNEFPYISGTDWTEETSVDNSTVRRIQRSEEADSNESMLNCFFRFGIPQLDVSDYFDIQGYVLKIRYKDTAKGEYQIKRQSINEGNDLEFMPLPNAKIICVGDGKWKEAEVIVRPQDLGWYMGEEYQTYHVEQLEELYSTTGDWMFRQYAEKWKYYIEKKD